MLGWIGRPLSLGVLAFLPVLLGLGSYYPTYFAQRARGRVVFVVAGASALSFATLALAPLAFVRVLCCLSLCCRRLVFVGCCYQ